MKIDGYTPNHPEEKAIIAFAKSQELFTYADLEKQVPGSKNRRTNLINRLQRMDMLFCTGTDHKKRKLFTALTKAQADKRAAAKRKDTTGMMWSAMRSLVTFSAQDVMMIVKDDVPQLRLEFIKSYCSNLLKADYLIVEQRATRGMLARYRLVKNSGPLAPKIMTLQCVVDGNTDKAAYVAGNRI